MGGGKLCRQSQRFGFEGHWFHSLNGLVKQAQGTHRLAKKSIKLTTPDGKELECGADHVVTAKGAANHVSDIEFVNE
jgi:hypothetical protein